LIDADEVSPSIAQRLGLQLLPNLRSALDALNHRPETLGRNLVPVGRFMVLTGLSGERDWMEIRSGQIADLLSELSRQFAHVVVNCGSLLEQVGFADSGRFGITRQVVASADRLVGVGLPTPVGITRLLAWAAESSALNPTALMHLIVNRRPRSRYRRAEVIEEIDRAIPGVAISFLPQDPQVETAAWAGSLVSSGQYLRTVRTLADRIART
jgi:MinD-like ATPase involved in chromosome partitioning or flagellar assembly